MGILRTDRVTGLGGANAIKGSVKFTSGGALDIDLDGATIGTSNFTIEAWVFWFGGYYHQITGTESNNFNFYINNDDGDLVFYDGSSSFDLSASNIKPNEWTHIALVREGTSTNQTKVYLNGTNTQNITVATNFSFARLATGTNYFGGSVNYGNGYQSNLRFTLDAVYTSAFTPSNNELTALDNTIVLCCQSPGNILQEATGKTITTFKHTLNSADAVASHFTPNSPVGFSTTTDVGTQFGSTFDGVTTFDSQAYMVPPGGNTRERNRGRGIYGLGGFPSYVSTIDFLAIQSTGNAQVFGDLTVAASFMGAAGSQTRAVFSRRYNASGGNNTMDFVTIANTANAIDFGDATTTAHAPAGCGNNTRGLFGGGATTNILEFITFATAGNAQDFGDLYSKRDMGGLSNSTRGVFAGGGDAPQVNTIQFVTISTTGNGSDFGDLTQETQGLTGSSNSTRGIFAGGYTPTLQNTIQFITIATTGNATDFGDLTFTSFRGASCSSPTRSVIMRGWSSGGNVNDICFVTISTTGNAQDFGDKTSPSGQMSESGTSDCHGGLE